MRIVSISKTKEMIVRHSHLLKLTASSQNVQFTKKNTGNDQDGGPVTHTHTVLAQPLEGCNLHT